MKPVSAICDDQTLTRAQHGDTSAFEVIYRRHVGQVRRRCRHMAPDADVDALVQESFVQAWRHLPSFRGESALGTWLHQIATRVVLMDRRSKRRRIPQVQRDQPVTTTAARRSVIATVDLTRAIALLPPKARRVFVLHDIEGYRHREIAVLMNVTQGTSKAQLHRARKLLREHLT